MRTRFLIFLSIVGIAEFYGFVFIRSITKPLPTNWRLGITIAYVAITLLTWASFMSFRMPFWDNVPHVVRNFIVAFTMGLWIAKILVAAIMLLDDIRRLCLWVLGAIYSGPISEQTQEPVGTGISRSTFFKRVALIVGSTTLGAFVYGITNRYNYKIHRIALKFDNLPNAFKGLKMVQISDIHSGSFDNHRAVEKGIEKVMEEKADIIFFTGDLVNDRADEVEPFEDIFANVSAPLGVYSTLGNHDYGDYVSWPSKEAKKANLDRLKAKHGKIGWKLMMNEHVVLEKRGRQNCDRRYRKLGG